MRLPELLPGHFSRAIRSSDRDGDVFPCMGRVLCCAMKWARKLDHLGTSAYPMQLCRQILS